MVKNPKYPAQKLTDDDKEILEQVVLCLDRKIS
jgi:hypothetical protein